MRLLCPSSPEKKIIYKPENRPDIDQSEERHGTYKNEFKRFKITPGNTTGVYSFEDVEEGGISTIYIHTGKKMRYIMVLIK